MGGVEVVVGDLSPHGQLLAAFATLKKEKDALLALTDLQKNDKMALADDLNKAKKTIDDEQAKIEEYEARLELKAVSAECQIAEVESFSTNTLSVAIEKNSKYSERVLDLEFYIEESKKEKERLLQRTAALARRDQLQKASINAMSDEINNLTRSVQEFEDRFSLLATRSAEMSEFHKEGFERREESQSSGAESLVSLEKASAKWMVEKKEMTERIHSLETSCEALKQSESIMKDTYVKTLTQHKEEWDKQKKELKKQVKDLVSEKLAIETQVAEIAELLEKEHLEREGKPFTEPEATEAETLKEQPTGVKKPEVYNQ